jgi:hypothetical protein
MHKTTATRFLTFMFLLLFISACASSPTPAVIPTAGQPAHPTDTALPLETPPAIETTVSTPSLPQPALELAQYVMNVGVNYSNKSAVVEQTITYPNASVETLTSLVLAVEPNLWSGGFSLKSLVVGKPVPRQNHSQAVSRVCHGGTISRIPI